jgi:hypothetical protein
MVLEKEIVSAKKPAKAPGHRMRLKSKPLGVFFFNFDAHTYGGGGQLAIKSKRPCISLKKKV